MCCFGRSLQLCRRCRRALSEPAYTCYPSNDRACRVGVSSRLVDTRSPEVTATYSRTGFPLMAELCAHDTYVGLSVPAWRFGSHTLLFHEQASPYVSQGGAPKTILCGASCWVVENAVGTSESSQPLRLRLFTRQLSSHSVVEPRTPSRPLLDPAFRSRQIGRAHV